MNDFSEIENELKKLRPAPISATLIAQVEKRFREESSSSIAELAPKRATRANWISLGVGLGLAAAAGFLMLARVRDNETPKPEHHIVATTPVPNERGNMIDSGKMIPAGLTEVVYHTRDEGLHFPEGATEPVRRMRRQTQETLRWQNPQTGASLRVSYPSEEVMLLPVSGQ